MSRTESIDPKFLKAIVAWVRDGDAEPLISAMRIGYPKTDDELTVLAGYMRNAKFKKKRGRSKDFTLIGAAALFEDIRRKHGMSVDDSINETIFTIMQSQSFHRRFFPDDECLWQVPDREKLRLYVTRSARSKDPKARRL